MTPQALEPLRSPVFRGLWLAWLAANMTMWMNDVAAAWLMTSLTTSPVMVALVQTASTLPVFLLGLPSGALADIIDRRRYFAATQLWVSINALVLAALALAGQLTAPLLLGFILGPMMEENLRRALLLSRGDWTTFATRPLSAGLLLAALAMVVVVSLPAIKSRREEAFQDAD